MIPLPTPTTAVSKRVTSGEKLTKEEMREFMNTHGLADKEFAQIMGVTMQAVRLWLTGDRSISITISRLVRLFTKYPNLLREF